MLNLLNRTTLIESLPHGGVCAEIGVATGEFSEVILKHNRPKMLYLIDSWVYHNGPSRHDPSNASDEVQQGRYEAVCQRFAGRPDVTIMRDWSELAAAVFPDDFFDWAHIDADHLDVTADILAWWPKVRPGGWITGHDYTVAGDYITVKTDVDKFVAQRGLELFVTTGDDDIYERNYPSWAFRKP